MPSTDVIPDSTSGPGQLFDGEQHLHLAVEAASFTRRFVAGISWHLVDAAPLDVHDAVVDVLLLWPEADDTTFARLSRALTAWSGQSKQAPSVQAWRALFTDVLAGGEQALCSAVRAGVPFPAAYRAQIKALYPNVDPATVERYVTCVAVGDVRLDWQANAALLEATHFLLTRPQPPHTQEAVLRLAVHGHEPYNVLAAQQRNQLTAEQSAVFVTLGCDAVPLEEAAAAAVLLA